MNFKIQPSILRQYLAAIMVSMGMFVAGLSTGWTGNITDALFAGEYNDIIISATDLAWIISLPTLAAMIFSLPWGVLCDRIGRKPTLLNLALCIIIGWFFIVFAKSTTLILIGRFVIGVGMGGCFHLIALYNIEIAEKEVRAKFVSFPPLLLNGGVLVAYILGYAMHIRVFTIICATISILYFLILLFQDETPTYKVKQNDYESARNTLLRLRKKSYDVDAEIEEIKTALKDGNKPSLIESLQKRSTKIAILVTSGTLIFLHFGGFAVVVYYTTEIFTSAQSSLHPKHATIILGAVQVVTALFSTSIIEMFRRRVLVITSFLLTSIGLVILGIYFTLTDRELASDELLSTLGFMPILGLIIFTLMCAIVSPIPIVFAAELYPAEIKPVAMSVTGVFIWLLIFLVTRFYGDLKLAVGGDVTFYIFAGMCFLGSVFSYLTVPETKNKTFEQIQVELNMQIKEDS